ncbi:inositol polyphosphate 5-phosphatase, putative [Entamoeba histolytica HM-1:IMSS-B]|uniref:Inositol polyphosphate 5-phosphatase, putative n=4 Tax=Entamoeba histolytica TaxID=5759 RepID=C4M2Q4_ENTH1|nr:inositol polyphosphate 5-phosphatase, putative [Entamoeba histolytica HM-1:IMSS]EAL44027.1 inositol polyphosphate 5-phosphatase, putative [Entamoeba histolytica HM-1:IMSS]EMH77456.1 inositol polyphosphate 5-phosphatase, putative [Entamoeba histolytica HM-1:IMSS-B]ENY61183.1 type II inositol-1,4,5-trisphosphate 5-phosphatase precursor, putative [Entamoeba histolytica HM-1:IMSS-A]GAT95565.1 inositol polyphosphate 5-phosphatase putative [Entamoeba histolytica]|eukprot:XP_649417.1 inositol polyphosphate 5-phosphatase, putative [Entamoeba histolytica HM-1:IMSS]
MSQELQSHFALNQFVSSENLAKNEDNDILPFQSEEEQTENQLKLKKADIQLNINLFSFEKEQKQLTPRTIFSTKPKVKFGQLVFDEKPQDFDQIKPEINVKSIPKPIPRRRPLFQDAFNSEPKMFSPRHSQRSTLTVVPSKSASLQLNELSSSQPISTKEESQEFMFKKAFYSKINNQSDRAVTSTSQPNKINDGISNTTMTRPLTIGKRTNSNSLTKSSFDVFSTKPKRNAITLRPTSISSIANAFYQYSIMPQEYLDKPHFTIKTPHSNIFNPIQPINWIVYGIEPSRQEIANNLNLYNDIRHFVSDKEQWKKENILNYLPFYANAKQIGVLACTWNVNQSVFTRREIDEWTDGIRFNPDIVVCGMQELEMSVDAIITGKKFSDKSIQYEQILYQSLNRGKLRYEKLGYYQLCGVVLYVFFNTKIQNEISEVGFENIRVGAMSGALANKGGVAYRMKVYDSTICFVVSHLAAHQEFWNKRNEDWAEISKMKISYYDNISRCNKKVNLLQHDIVIWMGDLNYRIEMSDNEVRKNMIKKDYIELAKNDQLLNSIRRKQAFHNFYEALINFGPTFKIKIGENNEYKENRIPSWCDRVLWKTENRHFVEAKEYTSHELYTSDHKPVTCFMSLDLQCIDQTKKQEIQHYLDEVSKKYINVIIPNVSVEPNIITIDNVELLKQYTTTIVLKNNGKFDVKYQIEESNQSEYHEDWLTINQCEGVIGILEGKSSINIPIQVYISQAQAWMYQDRNLLLKKINIWLGDNHSQSISFSVIAKTPTSVIGMRLESLNRLARPLLGSINKEINYSIVPFYIPKELYRLTNYIIDHYQQSCFVEIRPSVYTSQEMRSVIHSLNTESPFPNGPIQLFCDASLMFISGLHECCIYYNISENSSVLNDSKINQIIKFATPDEYRRLFFYLISFLKKLIEMGEDKIILVTRFAPHIFRCYNPTKISPFIHFLSTVLTNPLSFLIE